MDLPDLSTINLNADTKTNLIIAWLIFKGLAELYSSVVSGGGLKRIAQRFIMGEQVPQPIAKEYKAELSTSPLIPVPSKNENPPPPAT